MAQDSFFWGNQWWNAKDKAAFTKWLQRHGVKYNTWAKRHPGSARVFSGGGGVTTSAGTGSSTPGEDPYTAAARIAERESQAQIDSVNRQRERAAAQSQAQMQNLAGMYKALAGMLGGIGPATESTYQNASSQEAAIGKGFSDAQAAIQSGEATDVGSFLNKIGAPQEQVSQVLEKVGGPGAADVVYGLGAAIPASALNREGAAFTAAANRLPATASGMGMDRVRQAQSEFAETSRGFDDQVADIIGQQPSRVQELLDRIKRDAQAEEEKRFAIEQQRIENQRAERALRIQEAYYGKSVGDTKYRRKKDKLDRKDKLAKEKRDREAKVKAEAQEKIDKAKGARKEAVKAREDAFAAARTAVFAAAKSLRKPLSADDRFAWSVKHKKPLSAAPQYTQVNYAAAKKSLFNQYKHLLRYATASGKDALKRRLNQMIDEALRAAGITPAKKPAPTQWRLSPSRPTPTVGGRPRGD